MSTPKVQIRGVIAFVNGSEVLHLEITKALSTLTLNLRLSILNLLINFLGKRIRQCHILHSYIVSLLINIYSRTIYVRT